MQTESSAVPGDMIPGSTNAGQISVVIPAYNASKYLAATLRSVLEQSRPPSEIIVVDDGSTDDTVSIALSFGARVISVPNGGPSAARNAGTRAASGEYIAYIDADDLWAADKLECQVATLMAHTKPAFSFTDYRLFDERGVYGRPSELLHHWAFRKIAGTKRGAAEIWLTPHDGGPVLYDSYIPPSAVVVRRADALAVGGFDETLRVTEDFEFYLRLLKIVPAVAVMKPLLLYRQHPGQATADATLMRAGFFDVAARVAAAPDRYPLGDARYILDTEFLRYFSVGIKQARIGQFDVAVLSFQSSLKSRWSARAFFALIGSLVCRSAVGQFAFNAARTLWKSRPRRR